MRIHSLLFAVFALISAADFEVTRIYKTNSLPPVQKALTNGECWRKNSVVQEDKPVDLIIATDLSPCSDCEIKQMRSTVKE